MFCLIVYIRTICCNVAYIFCIFNQIWKFGVFFSTYGQWPLVMLKARNIEACNWNLDIKLAIVDWALQHYIALRPLIRGPSTSVPVVEEPIFEPSEIDSISGMRRTGMTWASTGNVGLFTVQGGPNDPVGHRPVSHYKKITLLGTLQLENLFR